MAKRKKKNTKSKKKDEQQDSGFWPLAGAILMMLTAGFLLIGGFGAGGPLPEGLFNAAFWAFGWAAYLTPPALLALGFWKFMSEDKQIPLEKFASMVAFVVLSACLLFTAFASDDGFGEYTGGHGGAVGELIGGITLSAITSIPASIMFLILAMLAFFLAFGISPKVLLALVEPFKRKEDTDLEDLKEKKELKSFQLKENVPVEHHSGRTAAAIKNTAEKLTPEQDHSALTTANDPSWKLPSLDLLEQKLDKADAGNVEENAQIIKDSFANFNIDVEMEGANIGPRVTQFTMKPPNGVRLSKITTLDNNLALDLAAESIRIEAPIPGKRAVGIEVPNL